MSETPWFPKRTPPVRNGLYKVSRTDLINAGQTEPYAYVLQIWCDGCWMRYLSYGFYGDDRNMIWRGLTGEHR